MPVSTHDQLPPTPEFDADGIFSDEPLRQAREQVRRGDWQAARTVIEDAGEDWTLRNRRISWLALAGAADDGWVDAWLQAEPSDPTAVLMQAEVLLRRAGLARGIASRARTTAEQLRSFDAYREAAALILPRAIELAGPRDPTPWIEKLRTMLADRQARETSFDEVYAEAQRRDPFNFDLHWVTVNMHLDKWGGSHERSFAVARAAAEAAPAGSGVLLLPLNAHIEYVKREFYWDVTGDEAWSACTGYFQRPEVQEEVDHWITKWRAGTPHPTRRTGWLQWLAIYYTLAGRREQAKGVFDEIGPRVRPELDWTHFWDSAEIGYLTSWRWAHGG